MSFFGTGNTIGFILVIFVLLVIITETCEN
ncbi:dihydroorotate dehydrogenase [Aneurinibacillus sp. Ricciae_BoGa-3]|nr:dihydroorotate dehydrogenase [Aneurinibacillus sp. Ricciae_BoGa-3]WCK56314.1 dihydroorotate dehydrogenase [Aneurinibacillus sp. Ricciae_BoGa-3]